MGRREDWYLKKRGEAIFAGYEKDLLFSDGEGVFEGYLQQVPNAYDVVIKRYYEVDETKRVLNTRVVIQSLAGYKNINNSRKILARKSFGLRTGDLVEVQDKIWLVTDWVNRQRTTDDYSSLTLCSHTISFEKEEKIKTDEVDDFGRPKYTVQKTSYDIACYYTTNVIDSYENGSINLPDNRARAYIQYTNLLKVGDEVVVAGSHYRIYGIDNSYMETNDKSVGYEYGVMILTLEMPVKTT